MFGWKDQFSYAQCAACGSLHLLDTPADMGRYYPSDYYSLTIPNRAAGRSGLIRAPFSRWVIASRSLLARLLAGAMREKYPFLYWMRLCNAGLGSSILDVGCGSGGLLYRMCRWGFSDLHGIDPYTQNVKIGNGLTIERASLDCICRSYDVIMFNHVLEHVPDALAALAKARTLLRPKGRILVRLPVAGSYAARTYGANWFNLDAPRHITIPSVKGMSVLAERAGLAVVVTEFDSTEVSLWMSEQYRRGVPMHGSKCGIRKTERQRLKKLTGKLNRVGDGDLGVFVLQAM